MSLKTATCIGRYGKIQHGWNIHEKNVNTHTGLCLWSEDYDLDYFSADDYMEDF